LAPIRTELSMYWNAVPEVIAILVIILIMINSHSVHAMPSTRDKLFKFSLYYTCFCILLNLLAIQALSYVTTIPIWVNIVTNTAYFIFYPPAPLIFIFYILFYVYELAPQKHHVRFRLFSTILLSSMFLYIIIVFLNLKLGWIFYFDENRNYIRGPFNRTPLVLAIFQGIVALIAILLERKYLDKFFFKIIILIPLFSLTIITLQIFYIEVVLTGTAMMIALLSLYLNFQTRKISVDNLTQYPNRETFAANVEKLARLHRKATVLVVSLDNFKAINDTFGQKKGDLFIKVIANSLHEICVKGQVYRYSGDEFAVIFDNPFPQKCIEEVIERFKSLWVVEGVSKQLSASFATLQLPFKVDLKADPITLLDHAILTAKNQGKGQLVNCDVLILQDIRRKNLLTDRLLQAIPNNSFSLHFQPIFSLASGKMGIAEALLRMKDPEMGSVTPNEFIPLAEELGIIGDLGQWVLEQVCRMLDKLRLQGKEMPTISVNFSGLQFTDSKTVKNILEIIEKYSIPQGKIIIELTESTFIGTLFDDALSVMKPLIAHGINFYLDDFGTGYSNLSYMANLPFTCIKIDRSILLNAKIHTRQHHFIDSIIHIVKQMGYCVIVEGVENEEQLTYLQEIGCDMAQGFHLRPPLEQNEFETAVSQGIYYPLTKITQ